MVDDAAEAQRVVVDGLGAVAVGVEQEPAVVVVAVLRARAGRAVVPVPGQGAGPPEPVDMLAARRDESDVQPVRRRMGAVDRVHAEILPHGAVGVRMGLRDPERIEHRVVEALRRAAVGGANRHVVEHRLDRTRLPAGANFTSWADRPTGSARP